MFWTCREMKKDQSFAFISRFEVWFLMGTRNFFLVPHLWQDKIGLSLHLDFQIAIRSISWDSFKTWSIFLPHWYFWFHVQTIKTYNIKALYLCTSLFFFIRVLQNLTQINIINSQKALGDLNSAAHVQQAAIWQIYGKK